MNRSEQERHDAALDGPLPVDCPICTGHPDAPPCGEDCAALVERCRRERQIRGLYVAAKRALTFARAYNSTVGPEDYRVKAVLRKVYLYRLDIAALRAAA